MSPTYVHPGLVDDVRELTPQWLTAAMQHDGLDVVVATAQVEKVLTDGQQRRVHLQLSYAGPNQGPTAVVAKLAATDAAMRRRVIPSGRAEVRFYRELAATVGARTPRCLFAAEPDDRGRFSLLLEDLAPAAFGDQIAGCLPDEARSAVSNLAALHGPRWCDPSLGRLGWLDSRAPDARDRYVALYTIAVAGFRDRFDAHLDVADLRLLREVGEAVGDWATGRNERFSILHGDYRLGRLAFDPTWTDADDPVVSVVDWRMSSVGLPTRDLAYFLATAMPSEDRRLSERELVGRYHAGLVGHGVTGYSLEDCWDDYRYGALQGPFVTILCGAMAPRSDYRDEVSLLMINRTLDAVRDLNSLSVI